MFYRDFLEMSLFCLFFRLELIKKKILYDLDELQAQFEKVNHTANRLQAEKEDYHLDLDRNREKCDKLQVGFFF